MASFPKPSPNSVHDFNADMTNDFHDPRTFPKSGLAAGVKDGLSMVEDLPRGALQTNQKSMGSTFMHEPFEESAGSSKGKSFVHKG